MLDFFYGDLYGLYPLVGLVCLYLAWKRPGLSGQDALMVLVAAVPAAWFSLWGLDSVPALEGKNNFFIPFFWCYDIVFMVLGALALAALRKWRKRSGLGDFLILLGCMLPLGRPFLGLIFFILIAFFSGPC